MRSRRQQHPASLLSLLGVGALLLAGCSGESVVERGLSQVEGIEDVEIDSEDGSVSIEGQDGESFDLDIDEDEGTSTITTDEGTVTTGQSSEVPAEIAAAFTPPAGFQPQAASEVTEEDSRAFTVQGAISGDWGELMDEIEASVAEGPWDEVQRQAMVEGTMGGVTAIQEGDPGSTLTISLLMEEDAPDGLLTIALVLPAE
ncbi:MAG: heavy metal-associated domain-containing protein [Nitriliruptoraceae bacterium]